MANIWEMHEAKIANSDDLISINFAKTGHVIQILNTLLVNAYFITSDTHIRKMRLITDAPKY